MSNLYTTIAICLNDRKHTFLDAILSVTPIDYLSTTILVSSMAALSAVDVDLPSRDSFFESVLEELESRGVDTVSVRQEIEMGYRQ